MTLATVNTTDEGKAFRQLESVVISNQSAASTAVIKAVSVPLWAKNATFYFIMNSMSGTSPSVALSLTYADFSTSPPTTMATPAKLGNAGLTIATVTSVAAVPSLITVDIGPDVAVDTTGSASASGYYSVTCYLPPYILYSYTTAGGGASPEDYDFDIAVLFRGH